MVSGRLACGVAALVLAAWVGPSSAAAPAAERDRLAAGEAALAASAAWRSLLLYVPRLFRAADSVVADPLFFLSPVGGSDPAAELAATLAAFAAPVAPEHDDAHALCRYPARRTWLAARLPERAARWPAPRCEALERWRARLGIGSVSLVFASNFLNNPASLFGHTFLRLHRRPVAPGAPPPPALLDYAVNFAATPTTGNPLAYSFLGLTGGFRGDFSLMPYYLKIQEYNNGESRDLWEYDLRLTDAEVLMLMDVLWELGPHWAHYYYIDENCSFQMLLLLDAVRPEAALAEQFHLLVTPADTLRLAALTPGLVGDIHVRPASLSRFRARMAGLEAAEQALVVATFAAEDSGRAPPSLAGLAPARRAQVLDTALDWIDYTETLAGDRLAIRYRRLQDALLAQRAGLAESSDVSPAPALVGRPDQGPPSMRAALAGGRDYAGRPYAEAQWRPTLHSLESPALGFDDSLEIRMLDVSVRRLLTSRRTALRELRLFEAESLPEVQPMMAPVAWRLALGATQEAFGDDQLRRYVEGGIGRAWAPSEGRLKVYGLGLLQAGWSAAFAQRWLVEPAALVGALLTPRPDWTASVALRVSRTYAVTGGRQDRLLRAAATWQPLPRIELTLAGERVNGAPSYGVTAARFY